MLIFSRLFVIVIGVMLVAFGLWIAGVENEGSLGLVLVGLLTAFMGVVMIGVLARRAAALPIGSGRGRPGRSGRPAASRRVPRSIPASRRPMRSSSTRLVRQEDARLRGSSHRGAALPGRGLTAGRHGSEAGRSR